MSQDITHIVAGDCSLATVREHRDALVAALAGSGPIGIDVSGVTQSDVSFVQLLASAARTAADGGRPFRLLGLPDGLARTFQRSGVVFDAQTGHLLQISRGSATWQPS